MELYEHQKEGVDFLKQAKTAILADEMGLGKTIQAITAAGEAHPGGTIFVVCPAALKINWEREIRLCFPKDAVGIISGRSFEATGTFNGILGEDIVKVSPITHTWIIINYDILSDHAEWISAMSQGGSIDAVIFDESHYIKGKSKRSAAAIKISESIGSVYCLTGTPLLNRPVELWNQLVVIKHPMTKVKGARSYFSRTFCDGHLRVIPPTRFRRHPISFWSEEGATNLEELRNQLHGYMLRRKKKDILNLPAKTIDVMEVEMTNPQWVEYQTAWDSYIQFLQNQPEIMQDEEKFNNILATQQLIELGKLKQVCSKAKLKRIVSDTLNAVEQGEKVIIFTQYVNTLKEISEAIKSSKIDKKSVGVVTLSGETKPQDRQKAVDRFQNEDQVKVFVGNIKAAGVGLTLTAASIVIFADMEWSPEIHSQAEDRAHRIGQTGTVNIYYYICKGTIEEDIVELLAKKKQIVQEVIDGTKNRIQSGSVLKDFVRRMSDRLSTEAFENPL